MRGMVEWFARNGVAANLMMAFILVSGLLAATNTNEEVFPEMELDRINVEVPYLGAAPEEVEEAVNVRIEEAIQGIDGIKQIQSTASEGMGTVMIELDLGARRAPGRRRGQEQHRRDHDVPARDGEADHPRADEPAAGGRHRGVGRRRPVHAEAGHRAGARRADGGPGDHAGRHRERAALRDLDRGLGGRPAAARDDVRPGGGRGAALVAGPAGRFGADGAGGDPAADDRAGVPGGGVRGPGAVDAGGREPAAARRRGDRRGRLRGDGPVRALRRRADDAGLRLPDRGPERGRTRCAGDGVRRSGAGAPPRGRLPHGVAERCGGAERPAVADAPERVRGVRAGVPGAGAVPGAAAGVLGEPGHPDLVPGGRRPDAGARRLGERAVAVRLRARAGHRGR